MLGEEMVWELEKGLNKDQAEDLQLVAMAAANKGAPDTEALLALPDALEFELRGIECEFRSGLEVIDQRLQELKCKKEQYLKQTTKRNEDRQNLQKCFDDAAALMQAIDKKENGETSESFSKGSSQQETATIPTSSPPTKPTKTPIKLQNVTSNIVTPETKKVLHSKTTTKLSKPAKDYESESPTKNPTKLPTNVPTKVPRIETTKKVNKSSTNEATVFTIKTNTPTIKPPKKPPPRFKIQQSRRRSEGGQGRGDY